MSILLNEANSIKPKTISKSIPFVALFFSPSNRVLLVDRQESRPAEWMIRKFFGAFSAVCSTSMSIPIQAVAKAMASNTLLQPEQKTEILENSDITNLGKSAGGGGEMLPTSTDFKIKQ